MRLGLALSMALTAACASAPAIPSPPVTPPTTATAPAEVADPVVVARRFVERWLGGNVAGARTDFDAAMASAVSVERLDAVAKDLVAQHGAFRGVLDVEAKPRGGYLHVLVGCDVPEDPFNIRVVFPRGEARITGFFFVERWFPPPYVREGAFERRPVTLGEDPWRLPGTLTLPHGEGPFPALVLVHGSGPNDRDETIGFGPNRPFRDLAEGLASRGIAVLRYDKRTLVHGLPATAGIREEVIEGAVAAVRYLRATPGIDPGRVFVLGHSQGGEFAPRIAQEEPATAGLVLMAGSARDHRGVLPAQLEYLASLDGTISPEERKHIDETRAQLATVDDPATPANRYVLGAPAGYWRELFAYDAPALAKMLPQPMLVLQGERDYQVTLEDLAAWKAALGARKDVTFRVYPKLNHVFTEGEGRPNPDEYSVPAHVPAYVVDDIAAFLLGR